MDLIMGDNKIKRFPYSKDRTRRLNTRKRVIPCQVSGRWLKSPEKVHLFTDRSYLSVDVMTRSENDNLEIKVRKLCELVLLKEDLVKMLEVYEKYENQT